MILKSSKILSWKVPDRTLCPQLRRWEQEDWLWPHLARWQCCRLYEKLGFHKCRDAATLGRHGRQSFRFYCHKSEMIAVQFTTRGGLEINQRNKAAPLVQAIPVRGFCLILRECPIIPFAQCLPFGGGSYPRPRMYAGGICPAVFTGAAHPSSWEMTGASSTQNPQTPIKSPF